MCVRFKHFPEFGVTLNVYSGTLTSDVMMRWVDRLEPIEWTRWINYLDPKLDLSGWDIAHFAAVRRALAAKLTELHGDAHLDSALVSASPAHEFFLRFWPSYVGRDVHYPTKPVAFTSLEGACKWLGLPEGALTVLAEAASSL
jgi:hypothetical protein